MRLEYTEEQEKQLRITEIEAILENNLYENELEEFMLEIEKQFLEGNETAYGEPFAVVGTEDKFIEMTLETVDDVKQFFMLVLDKNGNRLSDYQYSDNVEELLERVFDSKESKTMEEIKTKLIESLLSTLTYDDMTLEQERLVTEYQTEIWKLKVDELRHTMTKEEMEEQIHDWWLDYQFTDGTEENLLVYIGG